MKMRTLFILLAELFSIRTYINTKMIKSTKVYFQIMNLLKVYWMLLLNSSTIMLLLHARSPSIFTFQPTNSFLILSSRHWDLIYLCTNIHFLLQVYSLNSINVNTMIHTMLINLAIKFGYSMPKTQRPLNLRRPIGFRNLSISFREHIKISTPFSKGLTLPPIRNPSMPMIYVKLLMMLLLAKPSK